MNRTDFINYVAPYAVAACKDTGVLPQVAIARAIIESGDGTGNYATNALQTEDNNFFGMTYTGTGDYTLVKTWEGYKIPVTPPAEYLGTQQVGTTTRYIYNRPFKSYNSPLESFQDFVRLMQTSRYKAALNATDTATQAAIISDAGYATAPNAKSLFVEVANEVDDMWSDIETYVSSHPIEAAAIGGSITGIVVLIIFLLMAYFAENKTA